MITFSLNLEILVNYRPNSFKVTYLKTSSNNRHSDRYHIGLEVKKCGDGQVRTFSNNEIWNQDKHASLYTDYLKQPVKCPATWLEFSTEPLVIAEGKLWCDIVTFGYICLKPAN